MEDICIMKELYDVAHKHEWRFKRRYWRLIRQIPIVCVYQFGLFSVSKADSSHSAWWTEDTFQSCKRDFCVKFV